MGSIYSHSKEYIKCTSDVRWRKTRVAALKRDIYCQHCYQERGLINIHRLEMHHIEPLEKYAGNLAEMQKKAFDIDNVVMLCPECHRIADGKMHSDREEQRRRETMRVKQFLENL